MNEDIIPEIIPDPDNAIYSARVMGYQRENIIDGYNMKNEEDLQYWEVINGDLSILNNDFYLENKEDPEVSEGDKLNTWILDLRRGRINPYLGKYAAFYQELSVIKGRIYAVSVQKAGVNDAALSLSQGGYQDIESSFNKYGFSGVGNLQYILTSSFNSINILFLAREDKATFMLTCNPTVSASFHYGNVTRDLSCKLTAQGLLYDTWFPAWSHNRGRFLKNWGNSMMLQFAAGQETEGWIDHEDFGLCYMTPQIYARGYPEIWLWFSSDLSDLNSNLNPLGWVRFNRNFIGLRDSQFFNTQVGGHEDGEGIKVFAESIREYILLIKNNSGETWAKISGSSSGYQLIEFS